MPFPESLLRIILTSSIFSGVDNAGLRFYEYADDRLRERRQQESLQSNDDSPRKDMLHYILKYKDSRTGEHIFSKHL